MISGKIIIFALLIPGLRLAAADFILVRDGKPEAAILKLDQPDVIKATADFNAAVKRCTGTVLPSVSAPAAEFRKLIKIRLRQSPLAKADDFSLTFPDGETLLITATKQSLPAAFNYLLEEYFSCRFLFPAVRGLPYGEEINHYPASRTVSVPRTAVRKSASFNLKRSIGCVIRPWDWHWNSNALLQNSHLMTVDVFPVYKYAVDQSWPREMLPVLNGKKYLPPKAKAPLSRNYWIASRPYKAHWNPCFSHPKSAEIATANILEILQADPDRDTICLSINDNGGMCRCRECLKAVGGRRNVLKYQDYSPIYWKWVNTIADAVHKQYPKVYFTSLAYREVIAPPSFPLNKMVVPMICFELAAMNDPEVADRRLKLLKEWSEKAAQLDLWDYSYGIMFYLFPRIYFKSHSKWLEEFHARKGRAVGIECNPLLPWEGPKYYLMAKKMYDIKADPEKIVMDWCTAAVGAKSASPLRKYYQFWEDYWTGGEIRKTSWYASRFSTYLSLGELPGHTLALKKGDMKKLRGLMEAVKANAETPEQKKRAAVLMSGFEFSELAAETLFSELLPPEGKLPDSASAEELMQQIPEAFKAHEKLLKHPYAKYYRGIKNIAAAQLGVIGTVLPYLHEPKVKAAAERLIAAPETPALLRGLLKIWLGAKPVNLLSNGSFEEAAPLPKVMWSEGGACRSAKKASDGDLSFRMPPKCSYRYELPVQPGKTYLFMFDAQINHPSIEGKLNYQLSCFKGKIALKHIKYPDNRLTAGKWTSFSGVCTPGGNAETLQILIWLRDFEQNDEIYIDNVRVYCLDDLQKISERKR